MKESFGLRGLIGLLGVQGVDGFIALWDSKALQGL